MPDEDEFTLLVDADFPRVDLVDKGANGIPRFLITKAAGDSTGLFDPEFVRDLISKSPEEAPVPVTDASARERVVTPNGLTLTGSPKDIAAFIHAASIRKAEEGDPARSSAEAVGAYADAVAKADMSTKSVNDPPELSRQIVAKAVLAGCEHLFDGYLAPVEKSVVIGAEHDDILKRVCAAVFPGFDMADVTGSFVPAAQRTAVYKALSCNPSESVDAGVNTPTGAPSPHGGAVPDSLAALRAVAGVRPSGRVVGELLAADLAGSRLTEAALSRRVKLLKGELAGIAAELGAPRLGVATALEFPAALEAILGFGHGYSLRESVTKAEMTSRAINDLPDSDFAYIEPGGKKDDEGKTTPRSLRHFPVNDAAHVRNALSRAPQSPFGEKAMPKIRAAAEKLGVEVAKEAGVPDQVTKDMMDAAGDAMPLDDGMDGLDPTVPLAMPDDETAVPGDPTDPGSPAWEAIDAATAAKWLSIAARLQNALGILAEREMLEAASADPSDIENAFDLEDAQCAVDYVISTLAVFAAGETAEAELGAEMAEMCKALAAFDAAPLGVIEGLSAVAKSGRVLSSANEQAIRAAAESLQKVLASLPEAPIAKEKEGAMPINTIDMRGRQLAQGPAADVLAKPGPVVKTAMSAEDQARNTGPVNAGGTTGMGQPRTTGPDSALPGDGPQEARPGDAPGRAVVKGALRVAVYDQGGSLAGIVDPGRIVEKVAKADSDAPAKTAMQAVFDEDGNLVGIVDPADITPVAGAGGGSSDDDSDGDGMQAGPAAAAAPADGDMTPQPPADAGTPADAVGKAVAPNVNTGSPEALDSIIAKAVAAALGAAAPAQEVIAKQGADLAGALAEVELLKGRLAVVEETPAAPKVFTNGQVPPAEQLRGQDQGRNSGEINVAKALERKREMYAAPDAGAQNEIAKSMQGDAIAGLQAIYAAGPSPVRVQPAPAPAAAQ